MVSLDRSQSDDKKAYIVNAIGKRYIYIQLYMRVLSRLAFIENCHHIQTSVDYFEFVSIV